ncbi:MAG: IPT/TIG domain-containing protein [Acidobacteriia bacterium]|nr:IPT/TIG domain-containing protein [Terriglobia bacterium]
MAGLICLCALIVTCLPVVLSAQSSGQPSKEYIYVGGRLLAIETPQGNDTTSPVISAVSASPISSSGATVTWTTNEGSDSQVDYGTTTGYGTSTTLIATMVTGHSVALSGLASSTLYHYRVKSKDAAGNLAISNDFTFTTLDAGDTTPPTVPTNLTATAAGPTQINLSWTASTDDVGVTGYKIFQNGTQVNTATGTSYQDTGLTPSTLYTYTVSAYDAANHNSAQSLPASAWTQSAVDTIAPSVPNNLQATTQSSGQITLVWDASTDNVGVTGYKISRKKVDQNFAQIATSTATTFYDAGLEPATTYTYTVSAYDAANNNSAQSLPASATTTVSTVHNTSLSLNGATVVNVPNSPSLSINGAITVEAWINTTSANATQCLVDRGNSYSLRLSNGRPRFYIFYSGSLFTSVTGTSVVNDGLWHHIAGVFDGTQLQIYVDGTPASTPVGSSPPATINSALTLGGRYDTKSYTDFFNGLIDEVRISAAALYTSTFTPQAHLITLAGTKALWKFDDQNLNDSSGNGNHGTGQGYINWDARVPVMSPSISSVSPTIGSTDGGTTVTVYGYNFIVGATVNLGGVLATNRTVIDNTRITASSPAHAAGSVSVAVTNDDGRTGTLPNAFTYVSPPTVGGVSPNFGPISGGTAITITGANFQSGATVKLGGTPATNVSFVSGTSLTATTAAHAAGVVDVLVTNPNGVSKALPGGYSYNNPAPDISSLAPSSVFVANGAFTLTVNGSDFVSGLVVQVNGSGRATTFVSSNQVTALITAADVALPATLPITVVNLPPGGGLSPSSLPLTVNANPLPSITTIDPTNVTAGGGPFNLTVNGNNFVLNSKVKVGGNERSTTYGTGQRLTAQIISTDIANPGSLAITVVNLTPGGGTSTAATLTVNQPNNSLSLDGNHSYARAQGAPSLNITGPLTVEAWIKTSSTASADIVVRLSSQNSSEGGYALRLSSGKPRFYIYKDSKTYSYAAGSNSLADGSWHHVGGVYNGSQLKIYVDGVLQGSATAAYPLGSGTSGLEIGIGADLSTNAFNGLIDEVRLTADMVYTGAFTPPHHLTALANTKGLWTFDGLSTLDSSSSHNNLNLYGNATFSTDTP